MERNNIQRTAVSSEVELIILLALLVGVLYSLHLLVKDYQALTAARLLRFLFKRDINPQMSSKPSVRWKRILFHDPIQCARYVYCDLGARAADSDVRRGFIYMITLQPREEDQPAWEEFKNAYSYGNSLRSDEIEKCRSKYPLCPFQASLLFDLIQYLVSNDL